MRRIFGGFFFLLLRVPLRFGGVTLDLLPDFAGYLLIFFGTAGLVSGSRAVSKVRFFLLILAVCTGAIWLTDLAGIGLEAGWILLLREVFEIAAALVTARFVIAGVAEFQAAGGTNCGAASLRACWYGLAVARTAELVLLRVEGLALLGGLLSAAAAALFLVFFGLTTWKFDRSGGGEGRAFGLPAGPAGESAPLPDLPAGGMDPVSPSDPSAEGPASSDLFSEASATSDFDTNGPAPVSPAEPFEGGVDPASSADPVTGDSDSISPPDPSAEGSAKSDLFSEASALPDPFEGGFGPASSDLDMNGSALTPSAAPSAGSFAPASSANPSAGGFDPASSDLQDPGRAGEQAEPPPSVPLREE